MCEQPKMDTFKMLPDQFKTVQGKGISVAGKQRVPDLALIAYNLSKIKGNALLASDMEDSATFLERLNAMYDEGFTEDENGDEIDAFVLPIDLFDLSPEQRGVIVDCDLRSYEHGFSWLLAPACAAPGQLKNLSGVLTACREFVKILAHLSKKGYVWEKLDGHPFFFNADYGIVRFVYDGIGLKREDEKNASDEETDKEMTPENKKICGEFLKRDAADALMFMLVGVHADEIRDSLPGLACAPEESKENRTEASVDSETGLSESAESPEDTEELSGEVASGDIESVLLSINADALQIWKALPATLQETFCHTCFGKIGDGPDFEEWEEILQNAIADIETCVFCENDLFKTAPQCLCCGKTTSKENLRTKWQILSERQPRDLKISFGQNTILTGDMFGIPSAGAPLLQIRYSRKRNALGVKNLSNIPWHVTKDGELKTLVPGKVMEIVKNVTIEFSGYPGVEMHFLGYES